MGVFDLLLDYVIHTKITDDIEQLLNYILLYRGHQNDNCNYIQYYDEEHKLFITKYWDSKEDMKDSKNFQIENNGYRVTPKGDIIDKRIIPTIIDIFNSITPDEIHNINHKIRKEKENISRLEETKDIYLMCSCILNSRSVYKDCVLTIELVYDIIKDDVMGCINTPSGFHIKLNDSDTVYYRYKNTIEVYKPGEWEEYLFRLFQEKLYYIDNTKVYANIIDKFSEAENNKINKLKEDNESRFIMQSFGSLDSNLYYISEKINTRKK